MEVQREIPIAEYKERSLSVHHEYHERLRKTHATRKYEAHHTYSWGAYQFQPIEAYFIGVGENGRRMDLCPWLSWLESEGRGMTWIASEDGMASYVA